MVEPGAPVSAGQSVMELETDKAVVEVPSSVSGTVQEIRVKEGDKIKVGQVIFTVDGANKSASAPSPAAAAVPPVQADKQAAPAPPAVKKEVSPAPAQATPVNPAPSASGASEFRLPELGENISQGDLVRLMISPGSRVAEGQPVM